MAQTVNPTAAASATDLRDAAGFAAAGRRRGHGWSCRLPRCDRRFNAVSPARRSHRPAPGRRRSALQPAFARRLLGRDRSTSGKAVPGSSFSVGAALPDAFIVLPRSVAACGVAGPARALAVAPSCCSCSSRRAEASVGRRRAGRRCRIARSRCAESRAAAARRGAAAGTGGRARRASGGSASIFRAYDVRGVVGKTLDRGRGAAAGSGDRQPDAREGPARDRGRPRWPAVRAGAGRGACPTACARRASM